jgi:hypothetical protein
MASLRGGTRLRATRRRIGTQRSRRCAATLGKPGLASCQTLRARAGSCRRCRASRRAPLQHEVVQATHDGSRSEGRRPTPNSASRESRWAWSPRRSELPFSHSENCKIQAADRTVSIEWSELESGHWRAVCQCGSQDYYEPVVDCARLDPLDAKTSRHAGQCEFASETDPAMLWVILKVKDGAGGDYWWVECGACDTAWQVPHYAESFR